MVEGRLGSFAKPLLLQGVAVLVLAGLVIAGYFWIYIPAVPMETVMRVVHDYGSGHAALPSPGTLARPDEIDEAYDTHINSLLALEDFAELERIAQKNRVEKGRVLGGSWKTHEYFTTTTYPLVDGAVTDRDFQQQIAIIKRWNAAYPESATARISLAGLYAYYAFYGRGPGFVDSINWWHWHLYRARTALATKTLFEAATLKERDPYWFEAMQQVAFFEGWDKRHERELLDQAIAFEPDYYHYDRHHANYLRTEWYGEPGEIEKFAEETSSQMGEPTSSIVYFQIVSSLACYCRQQMEDLPKASWPKIRLGYTNLSQLYGTSNTTANRFAFIAGTFNDKASSHEAFGTITAMDKDVWYTESVFETSREWSNSP